MICKCQYCGLKDTDKKDMEVEVVGITKPLNKYYHKDCHKEFLKEKAFKEEEAKKMDVLDATIKSIYGVKEVPNQAFTFLQKLRNGEKVFGNSQRVTKRYKEGYDYLLIAETFEYCRDTIEYWNRVKDFNGFMGAFRYALSIIIDKIYIVEQKVKQREDQKRLIEKHFESISEDDHVFETNYKKPTKSKNDISDFLDD